MRLPALLPVHNGLSLFRSRKDHLAWHYHLQPTVVPKLFVHWRKTTSTNIPKACNSRIKASDRRTSKETLKKACCLSLCFHEGAMDKLTQAKLETVRKNVLRYLFRFWSTGEARVPPLGGYAWLNTTTAITPLAFFRGNGHESVYGMGKEDLVNLVLSHLHGRRDIGTELSSWAASPGFVLQRVPEYSGGRADYFDRSEDNRYVSIIDTEMLWETNQAFYVPLLDFLSPGNMDYPHEYLVHSVVKGPWHKAVPYSAFQGLGIPKFTLWGQSWFSYTGGMSVNCFNLNNHDIQAARQKGTKFGENFALPMTLAILCCEKREPELWKNGVGSEDLRLILQGIAGFKVPESWKKLDKMTGHIITDNNLDDSKQLTRAIRATIRHFKMNRLSKRGRSKGWASDRKSGGFL